MLKQSLDKLLTISQDKVLYNLSSADLAKNVVAEKSAILSPTKALVTWTDPESTGRSPKDTYIVRNTQSEANIDWDAPNNLEMQPEVFDELWNEALEVLEKKEHIYTSDRVIGADANYALPVKLVTDNALTALFVDNMFRPVPEGIEQSILADNKFTLLVIPRDKIKNQNYNSGITVSMDFDRKLGLVYGSNYCGSVKKLMFTVMNYFTPEKGILPLHCSANEGADSKSAVILGLSGTGKTTLSADEKRALLGDDEHGWSENGVANFENGCYAKLINLRKNKEPEIFRIVFEENFNPNTVIIENTMMYPDGHFDVDDERLTANSRCSYPLTALKNYKPSSCSNHPTAILFLTADANGVLPPVSKLSPDQAMLWFLMGYTSKLAGTETGITEPKTVFSRFFGAPFMPRNPEDYTELLNKKIVQHNTSAYLINTGWTGGSYGKGNRIDITITRNIVNACLNGELEKVEYKEDNRFHVSIPLTCPNVESNILDPKNTWKDKSAYEKRADKLANEFSTFFDANFSQVSEKLRKQCPGK